jgi:DNA modification methylase
LIELENAVVYHGSNLDVLPTLPDNSVDAIVTDPPYELGFMGKSWDSSGIAYSVELWQECLRVLKPGGHLLAFGGSRTWHRIAVAIEDAGFDVRDSIAWLYGSGFPKSLDISKAIDKSDAGEARRKRDLQFTEWMRSTDLLQAECALLLAPFAKNKQSASAMAQHYYSDKTQPAVPTADIFDCLRPHLPAVPDYIEQMVAERTIESENFKKREVIGAKISGIANAEEKDRHTIGASKAVQVDITAPATEEAKKWQGWGTALKPAFEPVVVARKPLVGTVAANVLLWGVGGLNIDGSRIGFTSAADQASATPQGKVTSNSMAGAAPDVEGGQRKEIERPDNSKGRWPANIILDEYTAGLLDEQSGERGATATTNPKTYEANNEIRFASKSVTPFDYADKGGASRFFYVAKASKKDRNEGLEDLEGKEIGAKGNGLGRACATCSASVLDGCECADRTFVNPTRQNFHPTVKPTALMEYLVKLVTPPGGTVLDPFTGSGSTGKAALLNGFKFIGIELTADYLPIIEGRLKHAAETYANQAKEEETKEQETLF